MTAASLDDPRSRLYEADASQHGGRGGDEAAADGITRGDTRLAIKEQMPTGSQTFVSDDGRCTRLFNGEIHIHRQGPEMPSC